MGGVTASCVRESVAMAGMIVCDNTLSVVLVPDSAARHAHGWI